MFVGAVAFVDYGRVSVLSQCGDGPPTAPRYCVRQAIVLDTTLLQGHPESTQKTRSLDRPVYTTAIWSCFVQCEQSPPPTEKSVGLETLRGLAMGPEA